jgi:hypothetical protein
MNVQTRLRTSLQRNRRVFSMLSAVIVLVSFTLKEELAEHVRDDLARIDRVIYSVGKLDTESAEGDRFQGLNVKLDKALAMLRGKHVPPDEIIIPPIDQIRPHEQIVEEVNEEVHDATNFVTSKAIYVQSMEEVLPRRKYYEDNFESLSQGIGDALGASANIEKTSDPRKDQVLAYDVEEKCRAIRGAATLLAGEALHDLDNRRQTLEHTMVVTQWSVYLLFILGWTLGMLLNLLGDAPELKDKFSG